MTNTCCRAACLWHCVSEWFVCPPPFSQLLLLGKERQVKETHNHVRRLMQFILFYFFYYLLDLAALIYDLKSCSKVQDDIKNARGVYWQAGETRRCQKILVKLSIWRKIVKSFWQFLLTDICKTKSTKLFHWHWRLWGMLGSEWILTLFKEE